MQLWEEEEEESLLSLSEYSSLFILKKRKRNLSSSEVFSLNENRSMYLDLFSNNDDDIFVLKKGGKLFAIFHSE